MSELEQLISKHLDGELSPSELAELRRQLSSSPDALAIYREMTAIRRAARRAPTTSIPSPSSEARLFHQLGLEGLSTQAQPAPAEPSAPAAIWGRQRVLAVAATFVVALVVTLGSLLTLDTFAPNGDLADASRADTPRAATEAEASRDQLAEGSVIRRGDVPVDSARVESDRSVSLLRGSARGGDIRDGSRTDGPSDRSALDGSTRSVGSRVESTRGGATDIGARDGSARAVDGRASDGAARDAAERDGARESQSLAAHDGAAADTAARGTAQEPLAQSSARDTSTSIAAADAPADSLRLALQSAPIAMSPPLLPVPGETQQHALVSAAVRVGAAFIPSSNNVTAEDLSVGLDFDLGGGHRLALLVGRSAAVTEQRSVNTHSVPARTLAAGGKDEGASLQRVEESPEPFDLEVGKELWIGLGYDVALVSVDRFDIGIGARSGVGSRSLRVGTDLPIRFNVSPRLALEAVGSFAYVVPRSSRTSEFAVQSESDGFLYEGESRHAAFSTYGVSLGLRMALY